MRHPSLFCTSVQGLEIQLVLSGIKGEHKVKYLLVYLVGTTVLLVYLIYYHYRFFTHLNSLLEHKPCLWHCALKSINKQQNSVCHVEHPLNFTAEVGMARGVDDVNLIIFVRYTHILCKNCDTPFPL